MSRSQKNPSKNTSQAGAEVADIVEESKHGMLTTEKVMVHSALIASCVLGSATSGFNIASKVMGGLGKGGKIVARVVAGLQVGADSFCVAVFTHEAFEGLKAAADDPEGITFTRLLGFFLQMGMNGLMLYGMKGSMLEAAGVKKAPNPTKGDTQQKNTHNSRRRYRPKSKTNLHEGKTKPDKEFTNPTVEAEVVSLVVKNDPAYRSLSKAKRAELERTMAADSDFAAAIIADPSLIKPWNAIIELVELKTSIEYLKALKHILGNSNAQKHLFY